MNLPFLVFIIPSLHRHLLFTVRLLQLQELQLEFHFSDFIIPALRLPTLVSSRISSVDTTSSWSRPLGTRNEVLSGRTPKGHCWVGILPERFPLGYNAERIFRYVVDLADIVIEMSARLCHTLKVFGLEQRLFKVLALCHVVEFPVSKRHRRLESVLDLPAIPVPGRFIFIVEPVSLGEFADLVFREIKLEAGLSKAQEATLPDL